MAGRGEEERGGVPAEEEQKHFFPFRLLLSCLLDPHSVRGSLGLQALSGEHSAERGSPLGASAGRVTAKPRAGACRAGGGGAPGQHAAEAKGPLVDLVLEACGRHE